MRSQEGAALKMERKGAGLLRGSLTGRRGGGSELGAVGLFFHALGRYPGLPGAGRAVLRKAPLCVGLCAPGPALSVKYRIFGCKNGFAGGGKINSPEK